MADRSEDEYIALTHVCGEQTLRFLDDLHMAVNGPKGGDGGPIVQGAMSALLQFAASGEAPEVALRDVLVEMIDTMLPPIQAQGDRPATDA